MGDASKKLSSLFGKRYVLSVFDMIPTGRDKAEMQMLYSYLEEFPVRVVAESIWNGLNPIPDTKFQWVSNP